MVICDDAVCYNDTSNDTTDTSDANDTISDASVVSSAPITSFQQIGSMLSLY